MESLQFSVVDVETTGLYAGGHDRIIEIAILALDASGARTSEYSTLVNPHRDMGPISIHGITAKDVAEAPSFEDIAGDVSARLARSVIVGHNVHFDFHFLLAEFKRLGHAIPESPLLCTIRLAQNASPDLPSIRLAECCQHFGIPIQKAHSAFNDALATSKLLTACLTRLGRPSAALLDELKVEPIPPHHTMWPSLPQTGKCLSRTQAATAKPGPSYLGTLVARLPASLEGDHKLDEYLETLDRVLEDRRIDPAEAEALFDFATYLGLGREQVLQAHDRYLHSLTQVASADGVVSESELADLIAVQELLGVPRKLDELVSESLDSASSAERMGLTMGQTQYKLEGKTICFTGEFRCRVNGALPSRAHAEHVATEKGMVVKRGVSRQLYYLVVSDPDSMSAKARKAREYGVRIIAEAIFWRMMGVNTD